DDREVQIVWTEPQEPGAPDARTTQWQPGARVVGVVAPGVRHTMDALRAGFSGCAVLRVGEQLSDGSDAEPTAAPTILVGDAESWQRHWALWQRIKAEGEMLILAESAGEMRAFTGSRELPPYAESHLGRAWSMRDGRTPQRVVIPQLDPRVG